MAQAHLAALILNVVSGRLSQLAVISYDDRTVEQAITFCDTLITDGLEFNDIIAKEVADAINKGYLVEAGVIWDTDHYLYKREDAGLPIDFSLGQNHPNPFNPVTGINFALPRASHVRLDIFSIVGRRVTTLVNRHMEAGYHTVSWDGTKFASGVYLYRLQAGEFVESKKMVLVK